MRVGGVRTFRPATASEVERPRDRPPAPGLLRVRRDHQRIAGRRRAVPVGCVPQSAFRPPGVGAARARAGEHGRVDVSRGLGELQRCLRLQS